MANPVITVLFKADTDQLNKGLDAAGKSTKSFGSSMKSVGKAAAVAGGAAGLGLLVSGLKTGIGEFSEAAKVGAQTDAVIKSTGKSAGVTADQVSSLSQSLMEKSGMDDEAIQSGENLLLTFTNIQNRVGKGNDIFNQATKAMLDMSVALGQDTTQSAIQLGKALNDPVKGMTALRRVGVSFTEAQVKQVKAMVEAGHTMEAQKFILAELNKEFGGSAEAAGKTLPGQIDVLKQSYSNLAGELIATVAPAFLAVTQALTEHPALFKALVVGVLALAAAMVVLNAVMLVTSVVASPITLIVLAIVAAVVLLAGAAYLVYKNWDAIVGFFAGIWEAIQSGAKAALDWVRSNWPLLVGIILGPLPLILALIIQHWADIKNAVTVALDAIKAAITTAWNAVKAVISAALSAIQSAMSAAWNAIQGVVTAAGHAVSAVVHAMAAAFNIAKTAAQLLAAFFADVWAAAAAGAQAAAAAVNGVIRALAGAFDTAKAAVSGLAAVLQGPLQAGANVAKAAMSGLSGIINAIAGAFNAAADAARGLVSAIESIPSKINLPSVPHLNIPGLAGGGIVTRPTLAMVGERGPEAVIPLSRGAGGGVGGGGLGGLEVRVFIGDTELRGLVRAEVVDASTGLARTLLAGAR